MSEQFYELAVAALAVWRLTHLATVEDGPWQVFARVRRAAERLSPSLVGCFYCASVWVAVPIAWWIGTTAADRVLLWLALSAAAILLERLTSDRPAAAHYYEHAPEEQGDSHVLRKE